VLPHRFKRGARCRRIAAALEQIGSVLGVSAHPEGEDDVALLPVGELKGNLDRGTGVQGGPHLAGKPRPGQGRRAAQRAVAPHERRAIAADDPRRAVRVEKGNPVGKLGVVGVSRQDRAASGIDLGDHIGGRFLAQIA
jgi:hypothetical protein